MNWFEKKKECECCKRKFKDIDLNVLASRLGPISFYYCEECVKNEAEPEWIIERKAIDIENISDWVKDIKLYKNGKYITIEQYIIKFL